MGIIINSEHSPEIGINDLDKNEENEYILIRANLETERQNWWWHGEDSGWPCYSA